MNPVPLMFLHWPIGISKVFSFTALIPLGSWAWAVRKKRSRTLHASLERLRRNAPLDDLTGVYSRRYFEDTLATEWKRAARENRPVAVLLLDVDYFKKLNHRYGQIAGDECLYKVARALSAQVRRPGDFVARVGGEEFAVVLPGASAEGAYRLAEAMRTAVLDLRIPNPDSSVAPIVTLSIGVCSRRSDRDCSPDQLLEAADTALYLAKAQGRDRTQLSGGSALMVVRREHVVA